MSTKVVCKIHSTTFTDMMMMIMMMTILYQSST